MTTATLKENENPITKAISMAKPSPVDVEDLLEFLGRHPSDSFDFEKVHKRAKKKGYTSYKEEQTLSKIELALIEFRRQGREVEKVKARHQYPILPYSPLGWRDENKMPVLVPFSLNNPVFSGNFYYDNQDRELTIQSVNIKLPGPMHDIYRATEQWATNKYKRGSYNFSTFFNGLIPVSLIPIIQEAKPLFENIFIIAEAGEYQIEEMPAPPPRPINDDPLVVGYYDGVMYLIAAFDLSPMEEAYVETASGGGFTKLERSKDNIMLHQLAGYLDL